MWAAVGVVNSFNSTQEYSTHCLYFLFSFKRYMTATMHLFSSLHFNFIIKDRSSKRVVGLSLSRDKTLCEKVVAA